MHAGFKDRKTLNIGFKEWKTLHNGFTDGKTLYTGFKDWKIGQNAFKDWDIRHNEFKDRKVSDLKQRLQNTTSCIQRLGDNHKANVNTGVFCRFKEHKPYHNMDNIRGHVNSVYCIQRTESITKWL